LTGVHLGGYGADLDPVIGLVELLEMIAEHAPVCRLRLSSIDPPEVTARLLRLMAQSAMLCPHLHVPVQAAEDRVLRRMRRRYDTGFLRDLAAEIRVHLPDAAFGTDVIAGFPGETDEQFEAGVSLLDKLPFTYFHVFPYSRRTGTTAAKMPDDISPASRRRRAQRLRALGERKRAEFAGRFVGQTLRVLTEGTAPQHPACLSGYSRNYQRVEVRGGPELLNREVVVPIIARRGTVLLGEAPTGAV
jgi:threonylcarbamoyladenosine tRNA methylthiotransferase MtaB